MDQVPEAKQIALPARAIPFPVLEFVNAANGTHPREGLQQVLAWIVFHDEFDDTGAKTYLLPNALT